MVVVSHQEHVIVTMDFSVSMNDWFDWVFSWKKISRDIIHTISVTPQSCTCRLNSWQQKTLKTEVVINRQMPLRMSRDCHFIFLKHISFNDHYPFIMVNIIVRVNKLKLKTVTDIVCSCYFDIAVMKFLECLIRNWKWMEFRVIECLFHLTSLKNNYKHSNFFFN